MFLSVPRAAVLVTRTVTVAVAVAPLASDPTFQVMVPFVPTVGFVKLPVADASDTNVVPVGIGSETATPVAVSGPALLSDSV